MHVEPVEIYSDATNAAIMRHPERRFPGVLIQGDTLYTLCFAADEICQLIGRGSTGFAEANEVRNRLWDFLNHYKAVLGSHDLQLPFVEYP